MKNLVQLHNPKSKQYVLINTKTGRILGYSDIKFLDIKLKGKEYS